MAKRRHARRYHRNPSTTSWILYGLSGLAVGVAAYYFFGKKATPATPALLPSKPTPTFPPVPRTLTTDGLALLPPSGTTASIPVGHACAATQSAVKAAQKAKDPVAFKAAVAQWNATCASFTLGL